MLATADNSSWPNKQPHLDLEEDIRDLLHLSEVVIELGVVRPGELLTHQLVRLELKGLKFAE